MRGSTFTHLPREHSGARRRLLRVYHRRLHSNLIVALRGLTDHPERTAETLGALIDGVYLRAVLTPGPTDADVALNTIMTYLKEALA